LYEAGYKPTTEHRIIALAMKAMRERFLTPDRYNTNVALIDKGKISAVRCLIWKLSRHQARARVFFTLDNRNFAVEKSVDQWTSTRCFT